MDERDTSADADAAREYLAATIRQKKWELRIWAPALVVCAAIAWIASGREQWLYVFSACVFALRIVALACELRRLHRIGPVELWRQECRPRETTGTSLVGMREECNRIAALIQEGKYAEAEGPLDDLLRRAPPDPLRAFAVHCRVCLLVNTGRAREAEQALRDLAAERPSVSTFELLGNYLGAGKRVQESIECFRDAVRAEARDGREYCIQARLLGDIFGQWRAVIARCDTAVRGEPRFVPGWLLKGDAHVHLRETRQAIEAYRRAAALAPNVELPRKKIEAAQAFEEGLALGLDAKPRDALPRLNRAVALFPDNFTFLFTKAVTLLQLERPAEALGSFDPALAMVRHVATADARWLKVQCLAALHLVADAQREARELLDLPVGEEMRRKIETLLTMDPGTATRAQVAAHWFARAIEASRQQKSAESVEYCRRAVYADPNPPAYAAHLALSLVILGLQTQSPQTEAEGFALYDRVLQRGRDPVTLFNYAQALNMASRWTESLRVAEELALVTPDDPMLHHLMQAVRAQLARVC